MTYLQLDTEHQPGNVYVVEWDEDSLGPVTIADLGDVPFDRDNVDDALIDADQLACHAGWLRSGDWDVLPDAYSAAVEATK